MQTKTGTSRRNILALAMAGILSCLGMPTYAAQADDYPNKPIELVIAYAPGGTSDILARLIGQKLHERLGQPVIIVNKPGGGGTIGTNYVADATPDGYTLLIGSVSPLTIAGALYSNLSYSPAEDFVTISPLAGTPYILTVNNSTGLKTLEDVIERGKTGELNFGTAGSGSPQHIIGEMFNTATGTKLQHIPYKGSGPMLTDLVGGQVELTFENPVVVSPQVKAGKLSMIAVSSAERMPKFPDVPTLNEMGVQGFDAKSWYGLFGPAKMPEAIVTRLNSEIQEILRMDDVQSKLADLGADVMIMSAPDSQALLQNDIKKWTEAVKASGATVN